MELKFIVEAILFSAPKPMNVAELRDTLVTAAERAEEPEVKTFKKTKAEQIEEALEQLSRDHAQLGRSYRVTCVAGSWQFVSEPEYAPWLRVVAGEKPRPPRLSQPALETLAIIAYRLECSLKWDPVKEQFIGNETANRLRSRGMREPWHI